MNKPEFIQNIVDTMESNGYHTTQKQSAGFLEALQLVIRDAISKEEDITIPHCLKISVAKISSYIGRHPVTGEPMFVPERKYVRVKALTALKESLS